MVGGRVWIVDLVDPLGRAKAGGSQAGVSQVLVEVQKLAIRTRFYTRQARRNGSGLLCRRKTKAPVATEPDTSIKNLTAIFVRLFGLVWFVND